MKDWDKNLKAYKAEYARLEEMANNYDWRAWDGVSTLVEKLLADYQVLAEEVYSA